MSDDHGLLLDPDAESGDPELPAFLSRPPDTPVYQGFPLIEETRIDGWCYGAITAFLEPAGCESGDGFVQAPNGSRAGLAVGTGPLIEIIAPEPGRWGVADLVDCFSQVLPELQARYEAVRSAPPEASRVTTLP